MKTILITGITGFLGRNLTKELWNNHRDKYNIVGISLSSGKIINFKSLRRKWNAIETDIPVHQIDISDKHSLETIFRKYEINYVIHAAAIKYMDLAEKQPEPCIKTNIIGTLNILELSKKYNVDNLINISTDKSIKPISIYGMSKYLTERLTQEYEFSIYKGVNFFWSDGSVLDIWYRQIMNKSKLSITNFSQIRYFTNVDNIIKDLIDNLDTKNKVIFPQRVGKITLLDLFNGFISYFNYTNTEYFTIGDRDKEKLIEELEETQETIEITQNELKQMITYNLENTELSFK